MPRPIARPLDWEDGVRTVEGTFDVVVVEVVDVVVVVVVEVVVVVVVVGFNLNGRLLQHVLSCS